MLNGCINFYTNKFQKELSVESILGLRNKDHFAVFRVFSGFHFFFFLKKISCSPDCPWTCYLVQDDLELPLSPPFLYLPSAGLQVCTTTSHWRNSSRTLTRGRRLQRKERNHLVNIYNKPGLVHPHKTTQISLTVSFGQTHLNIYVACALQYREIKERMVNLMKRSPREKGIQV